MYQETFRQLYAGEDIHLKPGESYTTTFQGAGLENADRLFLTGETALFYQWKDEPDYPILYRYIDDALDAGEAYRSQYALNMTADFPNYPKVAYRRIQFPPVLSYLQLVDYTDHWTMGIRAKAEDLQVPEGGYLRFALEVHYRHEDDELRTFSGPADVRFVLDIPEGTYNWTKLELPICLDAARTAWVGCMVEGENYGGRVFLESPVFISENGFNILADFAPYAGEKSQFNWLGQNLSRKEWPEFEMLINGEQIHCGEIFERCHRYSETEIPVPKGILRNGENQLTIRLISDYRDALAYNIHEIGLVCHDPGFVVAVPQIIRAGEAFWVLVKTKEAEQTLEFQPISGQIHPVSELTVKDAGLHALQFVCDAPGSALSFRLSCAGAEETCRIDRCVLHTPDGVSTGTADVIYIHQDDRSFDDFISWYFANQIGNLFTIRQSYRWNGTRTRNDPLWRRVAKLLNDAGVLYAHMVDGRELPGMDLNPTAESLQGKCFLGRQAHETDGCVYGAHIRGTTMNANACMYFDLHSKMYRSGKLGYDVPAPWQSHFFRNGKHWVGGDPTVPLDMEAAANAAMDRFRTFGSLMPRHTGPSVLFRYLFQAGFRWTGAELMYGPHEIILAALRGASAAYGSNRTGGHLAVQWSSSPHDTPERFRRYRLALYVSYIQGVHEINTEEGLWHLEEYYQHYHRFSDGCLGHLRQQQDFFRYVSSHSRTGSFYTPFGFLQGRFDGWTCFGRMNPYGPTWGRYEFGFSNAEKGWDILKYFYPRNVLDALYIHGCKNEPQGYYSGTPYGSVDIIPMESEKLSNYRLLVAPGYNKALPEDMDRLMDYVSKGGKLIIGWPQLSVTTDRADVVSGKYSYLAHPFVSKITGEGTFVEDTFQGMPLHVSDYVSTYPALLGTDTGLPLVYEIPVEKGTVYFVNAREYVGNEGVQALYTKLLDLVVNSCLEAESDYARGDEDVQFAVYDQGNGQKHIYFLATDWYRDPENLRTGTLLLQGVSYPVDIPFGQLVKVVACNGSAVWPCDDSCEVISFNGQWAQVQGTGKAEFCVAHKGAVHTVWVDFAEDPVATFSLTEL